MDVGDSAAWIALIGTVVGGAGLKIVESILGKTKVRDDTATSLRAELRTEVHDLRSENDRLEKSLDEWRLKYYRLVSELAQRGIALPNDPPTPPAP